MNIRIHTEVKGHYLRVMEAFDRSLFEALAPPFPPMDILEFTGSTAGDRVHIRFRGPIKTEWISDITGDGQDDQQAYFIDEGRVLPWPLKTWKHRHIVEKLTDQSALIIDDITYSAGWLTPLVFPILYLSFFGRKKVYRKYFGRP